MAKKTTPGAPPTTPEAGAANPTAPEAGAANPTAPEAGAAPEPAGKKTRLIRVRPTKGAMYEPFQRVAIPEGVETPLENSGWVISQIDAGYLEKC